MLQHHGMRTKYGELCPTERTAPLIKLASEMAAHAAKMRRIPEAKDNMRWERISSRVGNKRIGTATHHEIYDVTPNGRHALVCVRTVEGTEWGIKTVSKRYCLLHRHGRGVRVAEANKATAAKAAKGTIELGQAIDVMMGRTKLKRPVATPRSGFKLVRRSLDGELVSVWDGSPWVIGVARTEKASNDHTGGYYYYRTEYEATWQVEERMTFGDADDYSDLVLVEVSATGREFELPSGKLCATTLKVVRVIKEI